MNTQADVLMDMIISGLQNNGQARFRVISNSMLPLIRKDDWVTVSTLNTEARIRFGDIVLFRRQQNFIIHRVIKTTADKIITKGDRCLTADAKLAREDVLARVIRLERGNLSLELQSDFWQFLNQFIGVISIMIAASRGILNKFFRMRMVRNG
jgi:signal peptidase I